jgi:hypothetical protein
VTTRMSDVMKKKVARAPCSMRVEEKARMDKEVACERQQSRWLGWLAHGRGQLVHRPSAAAAGRSLTGGSHEKYSFSNFLKPRF